MNVKYRRYTSPASRSFRGISSQAPVFHDLLDPDPSMGGPSLPTNLEHVPGPPTPTVYPLRALHWLTAAIRYHGASPEPRHGSARAHPASEPGITHLLRIDLTSSKCQIHTRFALTERERSQGDCGIPERSEDMPQKPLDGVTRIILGTARKRPQRFSACLPARSGVTGAAPLIAVQGAALVPRKGRAEHPERSGVEGKSKIGDIKYREFFGVKKWSFVRYNKGLRHFYVLTYFVSRSNLFR